MQSKQLNPDFVNDIWFGFFGTFNTKRIINNMFTVYYKGVPGNEETAWCWISGGVQGLDIIEAILLFKVRNPSFVTSELIFLASLTI